MRIFVFLTCALIASCSERKSTDAFFQPVNSASTKQIATVHSDSSHLFSDDFWNYIVTHFESGSIELFYRGQLPYPTSLIADTTYCFSIVSGDNRDRLLRYFPTDLSEDASKNYVEEQVLRFPKGDSVFMVEVIKPVWKPAPADIEKEYQQFYQLLADKIQDQALVMKNSFQKDVLKRLRLPL